MRKAAGSRIHRTRRSGLVHHLGVAVTLEVYFDTLGDKTLAAHEAAAAKNLTTVLGLHAGAEAELLFAGPLRWLIGSLRVHKLCLGLKLPPAGLWTHFVAKIPAKGRAY